MRGWSEEWGTFFYAGTDDFFGHGEQRLEMERFFYASTVVAGKRGTTELWGKTTRLGAVFLCMHSSKNWAI